MMHKETVPAMWIAKDHGLEVGLITNGTVFTPKTIEDCKEICTWIRISADAVDPDQYAKEHGVKYGKIYPPGELWDLNDRRYWPFYAKAEELGVMLGMHMGHGYIYGANTHAARPGHLEDICREFYDLKILAFHFGWPWHHELNAYAACYPGLHIGMSFLNATVLFRPRFFAKLLGEAVMFASPGILVFALLFFALCQGILLTIEEPGLRRRFGVAYERYCRRVPRWLPGVRRRRRG